MHSAATVHGEFCHSCLWERICLFMLCSDAQRALELLQQYRVKLAQRQQSQNRTKQGSVEEDCQLQQSLDRVINVFQSQLFNALLGKNLLLESGFINPFPEFYVGNKKGVLRQGAEVSGVFSFEY